MKWVRVSKRRPCPICDHHDWCMVAADGSAAICPRMESPKRCGEAGWLHRLADDPVRLPPRRRRVAVESAVPSAEIASLSLRCQTAADRLGKIDELAGLLGVSARALIRLGVGWLDRERCWTWPLADAAGRTVGLNRRWPDGKKRIVAGHHAGLYLPADLSLDLAGGELVIVEGGSDVAAGLDLGLPTVGRFSCTHGGRLLIRLICDRRPGLVVIVADADGPGRRGAERLASALLPYSACLKLIEPPAPHKDLRGWLLAGATSADLISLVDEGSPRRLIVRTRKA